MKYTIYFLGLFLLLAVPRGMMAQEEDSLDIAAYVWMDSMVVTASKKDFDVEEFIDMVRKDKTFYKAFKNLRRQNYTADNDIQIFNKKGKVAASYTSTSTQHFDGEYRTMDVADEVVTGRYYKRKRKNKPLKYRYYTSKLYDRLFFTHGKVKEGKVDNYDFDASGKSGMEKYVAQLKTLIFSPGEKVSVPFIGNKTEIFSPKMIKRYDYSITSEEYVDGTDCYVFRVQVKEGWKKREKKTVIKFLETYFAKEDFQIMARNYTLKFPGNLFDFDVKMNIELQRIDGKYIPSFIRYNGNWNVPMKRRERCIFKAKFYDFKPVETKK